MNLAPSLRNWWELASTLGVGVTAMVAIAAIVAARTRRAAWHRAVWQVAVLGSVALVASEITGLARAGADFARSCTWNPLQRRGAANSSDREGEFGRLAAGSNSEPVAFADPAEGDMLVPDSWADELASTFPDGASLTNSLDEANGLFENSTTRAIEPEFSEADSAATNLADFVLRSSWLGLTSWWPGIVWLSGAGFLIGRVLVAQWLLGALRRRNRPIQDATLSERIFALARRLGLTRPVRVVTVEALTAPIAFGTMRPTIGLPARFEVEFDRPQQDAMLAHELAHLTAHDPAWNLLADAVTAALWWHPLVWWARHELRAASELAADDASLLVDDGPGTLAACLVRLGAKLAKPRSFAPLSVSGNGFRSSLGRRVERLLAMSNRRWQPPRRASSLLAKSLGPLALVAAAIVSTAWSRSTEPSKGEPMISNLRNSWRQSLAAVSLAAVFGSAEPALAQSAPADNPLVVPEPPAAAAPAQNAAQDKKSKDAADAAKAERDAQMAKLKDRIAQLESQLSELKKAGKSDQLEKVAREHDEAREQLAKWAEAHAKWADIAGKTDDKTWIKLDTFRKKGAAGQVKSPDDVARLKEMVEKLTQENAKLREATEGKGLQKKYPDDKPVKVDEAKPREATSPKTTALYQSAAEALAASLKQSSEERKAVIRESIKQEIEREHATSVRSKLQKDLTEAYEAYKALVVTGKEAEAEKKLDEYISIRERYDSLRLREQELGRIRVETRGGTAGGGGGPAGLSGASGGTTGAKSGAGAASSSPSGSGTNFIGSGTSVEKPASELVAMLKELREEVGSLRKEVAELRAFVKEQSGDAKRTTKP